MQADSWIDFNEGIVGKRLLDQLDTSIYWLNKVGSKLNELSNLPLETGKAQSVIQNIKGSIRMLESIHGVILMMDLLIGKCLAD